MENNSSYRISGYAGIMSAVLYIFSIIGLQYFIAADLNDVSSFTQNMMDSHNMMLLYGWPGLIATLLIIPIVQILYRTNKSTYFVSNNLFIATIIGLSLIVIAYLFHLALTYFYAPSFQSLNPAQQTTLATVFKNTIGLQDMFWLAGDLFAFLGIAFLMILGIRENFFPKWLLIFGTIACALAAFGSLSFIPAFKKVSGLSFLFIGGFSLFTIWEIIAGLFLIKYSKPSQ